MIRKIEQKDYKKIYELGSMLHENFEDTYNFDELLTKSYFHGLVYEEQGVVLGFILYSVLEHMIDILDIVVDPQKRHQKIGSLLLDEVITNAHKEDKFYLEVNVNNQIAIDMYEKFGFKKIHTRKKYYGEDDAYVMERVNEDE